MRDLYDYRHRRFTARQNGNIDDGAVRDADASGEEDYEARSEALSASGAS
ncbi:MAG: hypothetical protein JOZ19_14465 [Rubrobacter sp.]|nr:hypothetical protein [Rubrobacter sp.]